MKRGRRGVQSRRAMQLAALLPLLLLVPDASREVRVALGVSGLLADDVARSGEAAPEAPSLFAVLRASDVETLALRVRVDGAPPTDARIERELSARINRFFDTGGSGARALRIVPADEPAQAQLDLFVSTEEDRVSLTAEIQHGLRRTRVSLPDSVRIPGRSALLPPLLAICVALLWRRTLLALFVGIYAGAVVLAADAGFALTAPLRGLWDVFFHYLVREVRDSFRVEILGFIIALMAIVGVASRAGGVRGLLDRLLVVARSVRSALLVTWGMGLLIFFDDYANCMLVGSTMRPLTDRLRISREKLAYIVDSTAAPVVGLSLLSTWIAFQVSIYSAQLPGVGIVESGYAIFLQTLPYRFYCILTLFFVLLLILTGRDFGPMARAEARARSLGQLIAPGARAPISNALAQIEPAAGMPHDWRFVAIPIGVTMLVTLLRIFSDGGGFEFVFGERAASLPDSALGEVLLSGSGSSPVFIGALAGLLCAGFLAGSNRVRLAIVAGCAGAIALSAPTLVALEWPADELTARYGVPFFWFGVCAVIGGNLSDRAGVRTARPHLVWAELRRAAAGSVGALSFAIVLLFEAWMIGSVCSDLGTADYLVALLSGVLSPELLPVLLFLVACAVAFTTGSSWSTMSILLPNIVMLAASLGAESALGARGMVVVCISAVFEGSIFGDHCSPISDTTVLSSVASASDHIDHVRTQLPYALSTGLAAIGCGYLPLLLFPGWSPALGFLAGFGGLGVLIAIFGRRPVAVQAAP